MRSNDDRDEAHSAGVIDSQSIKTSTVRGPEKGYDASKKIGGRKRHLLVDTQGHLLAVKVTGAECSSTLLTQAVAGALSQNEAGVRR
jgi:putative transposase